MSDGWAEVFLHSLKFAVGVMDGVNCLSIRYLATTNTVLCLDNGVESTEAKFWKVH